MRMLPLSKEKSNTENTHFLSGLMLPVKSLQGARVAARYPGKANGKRFKNPGIARCPSYPFRHWQLIDCLPQHRINIGVYIIRKLRAGVLQQPLSHRC
jgi:hypothetical protein